jgi:hypothetical protein
LVEETNNYYNLFLNRQMAINPCWYDHRRSVKGKVVPVL